MNVLKNAWRFFVYKAYELMLYVLVLRGADTSVLRKAVSNLHVAWYSQSQLYREATSREYASIQARAEELIANRTIYSMVHLNPTGVWWAEVLHCDMESSLEELQAAYSDSCMQLVTAALDKGETIPEPGSLTLLDKAMKRAQHFKHYSAPLL